MYGYIIRNDDILEIVVSYNCLFSAWKLSFGRESLNNGGQQSNPPMPKKWIINSHLKSLNTEKATTYDIGNPGPDSGHI